MASKSISTISVLDLAMVIDGNSISDSYTNSVDLARHVEQYGYHRYWLAEHHNMESVASSATVVLIGHIASKTTTIRVGSAASCFLITLRSL